MRRSCCSSPRWSWLRWRCFGILRRRFSAKCRHPDSFRLHLLHLHTPGEPSFSDVIRPAYPKNFLTAKFRACTSERLSFERFRARAVIRSTPEYHSRSLNEIVSTTREQVPSTNSVQVARVLPFAVPTLGAPRVPPFEASRVPPFEVPRVPS